MEKQIERLFEIVASGDNVGKFLAENKNVYINSLNKDGDSCLHIACRDGHLENVKTLLSQPDIDVNVVDLEGRSPLLRKVAPSNDANKSLLEVVLLLLGHEKIDVNCKSYSQQVPLVNVVGGNPRGVNSASMRHEVLDVVIALLKRPELDVGARDGSNFPSWQYIFENSALNMLFNCKKEAKYVELIELLLNHPKFDINQQDSKGRTVFMHLVNHIVKHGVHDTLGEFIKMALKKPDFKINLEDNEGNTLLNYILIYPEFYEDRLPGWKVDLVGHVISQDGIDLDHCNKEGSTPFMLAVKKNSNRVVEMIMRTSSHVKVNQQDCNGDTALLLSNDRVITDKLLENKDVDINLVNNKGITKFREAVLRNDRYLIERLQAHSKYEMNKPQSDGQTDLMFIIQHMNVRGVKPEVIQQYILDDPNCDIGVVCAMGTVLSTAGALWQIEMIDRLMKHKSFTTNLINVQDSEGKTFLHHLCRKTEKETQSNQYKPFGSYHGTPTHSSKPEYKKEDMRVLQPVLQAHYLDLNVQDRLGYTGFMYLIDSNHPLLIEIIECFLKNPNPYDFTKTNSFDQTVKEIAESKEGVDPRILSLLKKHTGHKTTSNDISITDQIKQLKKSIERSNVAQSTKEILHNDLECLASDLKAYSSGVLASDKQLSKLHKDKLRGCMTFLIDNLQMDVLDCMIQDDAVSSNESDDIYAENTRRDRVLKFLSLIQMKGSKAYDSWMKALVKTKQKFIAEKLETYDPYVEGENQSPTAGENHATPVMPPSQLFQQLANYFSNLHQ